MKRPVRSDSYQWKILESITDMSSSMATSIWDNNSALHIQNDQKYLELNEKAMARIYQLIDLVCTPHQNQIIKLLLEGRTQMEVAAIMNVNQSSITKAINGNKTYTGDKTMQYGGIGKKLKSAILSDKMLKSILIQIRDYRESKI